MLEGSVRKVGGNGFGLTGSFIDADTGIICGPIDLMANLDGLVRLAGHVTSVSRTRQLT